MSAVLDHTCYKNMLIPSSANLQEADLLYTHFTHTTWLNAGHSNGDQDMSLDLLKVAICPK